MPYILSPVITTSSKGMWFEGSAYQKESIYSIEEGKLPPVNYDKHILNSHSLTHAEVPKHTSNSGQTVESYFDSNFFHGRCLVIRLKGNHYKSLGDGIYHWEITLDQLKDAIGEVTVERVLVTVDEYRKNEDGYHDPNYVLTLSQEAADWLISKDEFRLYGTSWKSSDYKPGSSERPIHNTLFKKAVILECLELEKVPAGEYFLVAYPLRIKGASEAPVTPILFSKDELNI